MSGNSRTVFETPYFSIEQLDGSGPGNDPHYRLSGPDSAIVLVFNDAAEILVVRQFRPTLEETTIELPAGSIEIGEKPMIAASREVLEETGYRCNLFQLGEFFHLMMNRTRIRDFLFCGIAEAQEPSQPEEGIRHDWVSRDYFLSAAFNGGYRQLAGLGIFQLVSQQLKIDVLSAPAGVLLDCVRTEVSNYSKVEL